MNRYNLKAAVMTLGDGLLDRELRDARAREADYRTRLARHRNLSSKLRAHACLLREALRAPSGQATIAALLADVARLSSQALEIPRASIWLLDDSRQNLVCRFQLPAPADGSPAVGLSIATASCPGYIAALAQTDSGAVAVDDAWHDPRTSELVAYLRANDVGALLNIPIVGPGALHGVLCHEHQGDPRSWQEEEIDFATGVGAMVALALEAELARAEISDPEQQKLESLGRLAADVAHHFNNLLMVVSGAVEELREPRSAHADRVSALVEIDGAVEHAKGLTRQLLTYARREAIAPALLPVDALMTATLPVLGELVGPPPATSAPVRPRILVVEDNEPIRSLVARLLSDEGVDLLEAANLATARATLSRTSVDVLLADGDLPDGSGIDLAREAVERGQAKKVILMSGSDFSVSPGPFIDSVVSKPFRIDGLIDSVKRLLPPT